MKDRSNIFKKSLLGMIFLVLFVHLIQNETDFFKLPPLQGYVDKPEKPVLNFASWFSADYQIQHDVYRNATFGFRSLYVRLDHQIAFSFFDKIKAIGVIKGKENYFYEINYLKAYSGEDFLGEDSIRKITDRMKFISDTLTKLNKQLIIVFAAGKASYYPEYIPDNYFPVKGNTNYKALSSAVKTAGLHCVDFNSYFMNQKGRSKYPLYPKYGIHWSNYGAALAADSIIKKIENLRTIDMPNLIYNEVELKQPVGIDYDIGDALNLLFRLKSFDMANPTIKTEKAKNKIKPSVLVISDSFYWGMYGFGIANSFKNDHFWYYNKQVYPETFSDELFVEDLDLGKEIHDHDVFIIMATEATLPQIGWGFLDNSESFFKGVKTPVEKKLDFIQRLKDLRRAIKGDNKWMSEIEQKAQKRGISVDSMLTLDALWVLEQKKNN
jgi:hypothetical protein